MEIKGAIGSVGSVPVSGAIANLNGGDVAAAIGAAKSIGKWGLGLGLLGLLFSSSSNADAYDEDADRHPIGEGALVKIGDKRFVGVPSTASLQFEDGEERFDIPFSKITQIVFSGNADKGYSIQLADGTQHRNVRSLTKSITFATSIGNRVAQLPHVIRKTLWVKKTAWEYYRAHFFSGVAGASIGWLTLAKTGVPFAWLLSIFLGLIFAAMCLVLTMFKADVKCVSASPDFLPPTKMRVSSQELIWSSYGSVLILGLTEEDVQDLHPKAKLETRGYKTLLEGASEAKGSAILEQDGS